MKMDDSQNKYNLKHRQIYTLHAQLLHFDFKKLITREHGTKLKTLHHYL